MVNVWKTICTQRANVRRHKGIWARIHKTTSMADDNATSMVRQRKSPPGTFFILANSI